MATSIKSKRGLLKKFNSSPVEVQEYFIHLPRLINEFPMDVCMAYMFSRLEKGQNMALYCGVIKVHKVNTDR